LSYRATIPNRPSLVSDSRTCWSAVIFHMFFSSGHCPYANDCSTSNRCGTGFEQKSQACLSRTSALWILKVHTFLFELETSRRIYRFVWISGNFIPARLPCSLASVAAGGVLDDQEQWILGDHSTQLHLPLPLAQRQVLQQSVFLFLSIFFHGIFFYLAWYLYFYLYFCCRVSRRRVPGWWFHPDRPADDHPGGDRWFSGW
jgi:hypothetical protein